MTKNKPILSAIVAMAENRAIGKDNKLLWHIPEDLKHFKNTTMGKPMIMGRKSFESLPGMLPGRPHIVISRSMVLAHESDQFHGVQSIKDAIELASTLNQEEIFITGGGEIYKQTLGMLDRLYLTIVHHEYDGDTFFPAIDWDQWTISDTIEHEADENNNRPAFTIMTLEKQKPTS
jgi:dihydrofolate reductase